MSFLIAAIPTAVADEVRAKRASPGYGHPAHAEIATGHGPCRHCLRTFRVGADRRVLFTYNPFAGLESLPSPGPVFIHEAHCDRYPVDAGFPDDLRPRPLTLDGYAPGALLVARETVTDGNIEEAVERLFVRHDVGYIFVRDTAAGCYDLRIDRPC